VPKFSVNLSMLFTEYSMLERPKAARLSGFDTIEVQFPYSEPIEDWVQAKEQSGVQVILINTPPGDFAAGDRGLAALPGREKEFRASIEMTKRYVQALSVRQVHVMSGIPPLDVERDRCAETLRKNLEYAASSLAEVGAIAQVEALNTVDVPGYYLTSTHSALAAIKEAAHPNLSIQYDLYHMQIMEGDLLRTIEQNLDMIGHIQFADTPGRNEPGTGEINFQRVFEVIDALPYEGYVGAEYTPRRSTATSLSWYRDLENPETENAS